MQSGSNIDNIAHHNCVVGDVTPDPARQAASEPQENPNYKEAFEYQCDICYYFGDKVSKRVKWKYGVIVCRPCYLSMKEIQSE